MKPIYTLNAGEYFVGSFILEKYKEKEFKVWIPAKDEGIDLLVTDKNFKKSVSLQVKASKEYKSTYPHLKNFEACGWWTIKKDKLKTSQADFWVFFIYDVKAQNQYIIIEPHKLLHKLIKIHSNALQTFQTYFWIAPKQKCWEGRDLGKDDINKIVSGNYRDENRDFSKYLNAWQQIENKLKKM